MKRKNLDDVVLFFNKFSTLISNGVPLVKSLKKIMLEIKNPEFSKIMSDIIDEIKSGVRFSESLSKYGDYFSEKIITILSAGELAGSLDYVSKTIPDILLYELVTECKN